MLLKNNLFKRAKQDMTKLNTEYEALTKINNEKRKEISNSIKQKRQELNERKRAMNRHFDSIRNK
jgi:hypothetical protein